MRLFEVEYMKNEFVVNIIHRPELAPEYAAKTSGADAKAVVRESLGIFLFQQEAAHKNGLKTCLSTYMTEMSQLNLNLIKELDYLQLGKGMLKKDYSPFGDVEDWINI